MAVRSILQYPDPALRRAARVIRDLLDTLAASPGVALAAPQIGEPFRIIASDVSRKAGERHHGRIVLVNPVVRRMEDRKIFREGCLSVPDYTGNVSRFEKVWVEGLDARGRPFSVASVGFEALALQHEIDHLDGLLFLDRIASLKDGLFRRKVY
jgi:peptide deformylase